MQRVLGDFMNVASANLIEREKIQEWHEDLLYAVLRQAAATFQLQLVKPDGGRLGLSYTVHDDGSILEESKAGGIDFQGLPAGTQVNLVLILRPGAPNSDEVRAYYLKRGWGTSGSLIDGAMSRDRAFSKSGFGIVRGKVGDWK
jgi:hypothetical protein